MWKLVLPLITVLGVPNVFGEREFMRYYNGRYFNEYTDIPIDDCSLLLRKLQPNGCQNVTIISHGFGETLQGGSVQKIVEAYLIRNTETVLAFGYDTELIPYELIIARLVDYAASLATAVECLVGRENQTSSRRIQYRSFHFWSGGKILKSRGKILPRITGLDPSDHPYPSNFMLSGEYAEMVDVIHTDVGILGYDAILGTVDFFPNYGSASQPGCFEEENLVRVRNFTEYVANELDRNPTVPPPLTVCSHQRAYQFYAESILNEDSFFAIMKFGNPDCTSSGDITTYMGLATPQSATGCYFLITKASCPFGNNRNQLSPIELDVLCNGN